MIVIVIMGILVAVAIPVYGAVTKNAEAKTCKSNMSNIKSMASTWQMTGGTDGGQVVLPASTDISAESSFVKSFDGGVLPKCPVAKDAAGAPDYTVVMTKNATTGVIETQVTCPMYASDAETYEKHVAD